MPFHVIIISIVQARKWYNKIYVFLRLVLYFDKRVGQVKIQTNE